MRRPDWLALAPGRTPSRLLPRGKETNGKAYEKKKKEERRGRLAVKLSRRVVKLFQYFSPANCRRRRETRIRERRSENVGEERERVEEKKSVKLPQHI